ncbi:hypothetical protein Bca52824_057269 [Brassica carinata]|uniref:Uncharacterized protein n=1 Tax=Brassica carinata TaxID=52824 RepID=A0A8X7QQ50_BRACI|nr:hypothetical protein Bca52824_057269 [Brassica carinata]
MLREPFFCVYIYYSLLDISSSSPQRFYFLLYCLPLGISSCFESMASEKFGPHLTTILDVKHIEAIYELWGVDYAVEIELPCDDETLETTEACHFLFLVLFLRRLRSLGWLLLRWRLVSSTSSRLRELGRNVSILALGS